MNTPATPRVTTNLAPGERDELHALVHHQRYPRTDLDADPLVGEALTALTRCRTGVNAPGDETKPRETLDFCDELRRAATWFQDRARRGT